MILTVLAAPAACCSATTPVGPYARPMSDEAGLRPAPRRQDGHPVTVPLSSREDLSLAYTPGVALVCEAIAAEPELVHEYTWVGHTVAVVTDGSAVLGLGNIGPRAALPVMEGKAMLFKEFGGVDAVPICLDTQDTDEIVAIVTRARPELRRDQPGGHRRAALLRDRAAARRGAAIPVFHDDQHGTAIVVLAALSNAAALLQRKLGDLRIVISGAGAAGVAVTQMLLAGGRRRHRGGRLAGRPPHRTRDLNPTRPPLAGVTNPRGVIGGIAEALRGADVLIGVSGGTIDESALAGMTPAGRSSRWPTPTPEVHPERRRPLRRRGRHRPQRLPQPDQQRARLPRRLPGRARRGRHPHHRGMKLAAADAIAAVVAGELAPDAIVPSPARPARRPRRRGRRRRRLVETVSRYLSPRWIKTHPGELISDHRR